MKMWLVRNKDNKLYVQFKIKPHKSALLQRWVLSFWYYYILPKYLFPCVKWSDSEATEVELTIKNKHDHTGLKE